MVLVTLLSRASAVGNPCLNVTMDVQTGSGDEPAQTQSKPQGLVLKWGWLTLILSLAAVGAIGALVVVTSVQDIDTLSTVALALAILSFSAQLIITMIQSHQASQVNSDTRAALSDTKATTASLLANQREYFNLVFKAAMGQGASATIPDVDENDNAGSDDEPEAEVTSVPRDTLNSRLLETFLSMPSPASTSMTFSSPKINISSLSRDLEFKKLLDSFPEESEGRPIFESLKTMHPRTLGTLGKIVSQLHRQPRPDRTARFKRASDGPGYGYRDLLERGWLEEVEEVSTGETVAYRLTPEGLIAARILQGRGPLPSWAQP